MMQDPAFAPVSEFALVKSDLGDLKDQMVWERELMLSKFSKNWNDHNALGITELQLKSRQKQWLAQIIRSINRQGINALVEMFIVKGDNSSIQDVFRGILTTKRMQEVSLGQHFDAEWAEKLERNPFIQALVSIKLYFESLTEVSNVNLATELAAVLVLPSKTSLHELIQRLDAVIDPIAKTFTSLDDFLNYLKSSIQYEVIRQRAKHQGQRGRAWQKAYDQLRDAINKGGRLSLQNVETAVELAESHLRDMGHDEQDSNLKRRHHSASEPEETPLVAWILSSTFKWRWGTTE